MAEFVQRQIESMYDEIDAMISNELLTKEETEVVLRKRRAFEYRINKRQKRKTDFVHYIQYEVSVLNLTKLRRKRVAAVHGSGGGQRKEIEGSIVKRVCRLFRMATHRWKADLALWQSFIEFQKAHGLMFGASRTLASALQVHARDEQLWLAAARFEFEQLGTVASARSMFLRALRFCPDSEPLWLGYYHFELSVAERALRRSDVLLAPGDASTATDVAVEAQVQSAVAQSRNEEMERYVRLIAASRTHALRKLSATPRGVLLNRLIDVACQFDEFEFGRKELEELYTLALNDTRGSQPESDVEGAWHALARRGLARALGIARRAVLDHRETRKTRKLNGRLKKKTLRELRLVAAGVNAAALEHCFRMYDEAIAAHPSRYMLTYCLRTALELGALLSFVEDTPTRAQLLSEEVSRVAKLFDRAQSTGLLAFDACADALELVNTVRRATKLHAVSNNGDGQDSTINWCEAVETTVRQALLRAHCMVDELPAQPDAVNVLERPALINRLESRLKLFVDTLLVLSTGSFSEQTRSNLSSCVDALVDLTHRTGLYAAEWSGQESVATALAAAWRTLLDTDCKDAQTAEEMTRLVENTLARLAKRVDRALIDGSSAHTRPLLSAIDVVAEHALRIGSVRFGNPFAWSTFEWLARWSTNTLRNRPLPIQLYMAVMDIETEHPGSQSRSGLHHLFEDALSHFGSNSVDLWMRYVTAASTSTSACAQLFRLDNTPAIATKSGSSLRMPDVSAIYQRAVKTLRGDLVRSFVEQFTLFRNSASVASPSR